MNFTKGELTTGNNYSMYHWIFLIVVDCTKTFHLLLPGVVIKTRQKIKILVEMQNDAFITKHNLTFVIVIISY